MHPPGPCPYCSDVKTELRRRKISNGSIQLVQQCLTCGAARSSPVKASTIRNPATVRYWDDGLADKFGDHVNLENKAQRERDRAQFFVEHDAYLKSSEWRKRRLAVLKRANGLCEGCGYVPSTQVHHLTYDHWKEEFLWELVAICDDCHERVHADRKESN